MREYKQIISSCLLALCYLSACNSKSNTSTFRQYKIKAIPESVVVGKNHDIVLTLKNLRAADVWNKPENDRCIEITYNLEVTNHDTINGKHVFVNPSNFRLVLNNQRKITHAFYNALGADPQSTTISVGNIFNLPAKTKPIALDLFFADSVASVKILLR